VPVQSGQRRQHHSAAKFQSNNGTYTTQQVATGCTLVLAPGASFELDQVQLFFAGPFNVQGGRVMFRTRGVRRRPKTQSAS
jgi:hypothetical protein